jgi:hypothetical protein
VNSSRIRASRLQKHVNVELESKDRVRRDIDLVISNLPLWQAIQLGPLLRFYGLDSVTHAWLPTQLNARDYQKILEIDDWHSALTITNYFSLDVEEVNSEQFGIFDALARSTIDFVFKSAKEAIIASEDFKQSFIGSGNEPQFYVRPHILQSKNGEMVAKEN